MFVAMVLQVCILGVVLLSEFKGRAIDCFMLMLCLFFCKIAKYNTCVYLLTNDCHGTFTRVSNPSKFSEVSMGTITAYLALSF